MSTAVGQKTLTIALLGNPNTGKSTVFGALAGVRQRVGNYPGVTVEKKLGSMTHSGRRCTIIDLPGTYSLAPRSPDEVVAVDVLLGRQEGATPPDVLLCVVDASNLERNLYLVSQALEIGLPTVIALNMVDVAQQRGLKIDAAALGERLGAAVVPIQANRKRGMPELKDALLAASHAPARQHISPFPEAFQEEAARLQRFWKDEGFELHAKNGHSDDGSLPASLAARLLLDTSGYLSRHLGGRHAMRLDEELLAARRRLAEAGAPAPGVEAIARYAWIESVLEGVLHRPDVRPKNASDRLDKVLTHRVWGSLIFLALMVVVFQSVFRLADAPVGWIESGVASLGAAAASVLPEGPLQSLIVDGVIGGVGGVIVFLPQIFILFFFIAVLEDCGYMARAAYLMDKLMSRVGLSGKSFIPLLSSFACAIPGVMATRVIENRRDRFTTIMVAPLMSCSARLPVYALLIAAFIPPTTYFGGLLGLQGITLAAMYLVGMVAAVLVALVLKRTILRGPAPPFVMELPTYKIPSLATVLHRMLERGWSFIYRAGTLIVAVSILTWAALYYPHDRSVETPYAERLAAIDAQLTEAPAESDVAESLAAERAQIENEIAGAYQRQSYLGRFGKAIEPAVRPLGWDWRIGSAVIASFPAREVVIATLAVIYNQGAEIDVGDQADEGTVKLRDALQSATWEGTNQRVFTVPTALSVMVFFALCAQCAATLVVIKRETNSWRWPIGAFVYMTTLAYIAAFAVYQIGSRL